MGQLLSDFCAPGVGRFSLACLVSRWQLSCGHCKARSGLVPPDPKVDKIICHLSRSQLASPNELEILSNIRWSDHSMPYRKRGVFFHFCYYNMLDKKDFPSEVVKSRYRDKEKMLSHQTKPLSSCKTGFFQVMAPCLRSIQATLSRSL